MKIRNRANGGCVAVDPALGAELIGTGAWEPADKPAPSPTRRKRKAEAEDAPED